MMTSTKATVDLLPPTCFTTYQHPTSGMWDIVKLHSDGRIERLGVQRTEAMARALVAMYAKTAQEG